MKSLIFRDSYTWLLAFSIPVVFVSLMFLAPSLYYEDYVHHAISANEKPVKFYIGQINLPVFLWIFSFVFMFIFYTVILFIYRDNKIHQYQHEFIRIKTSIINFILLCLLFYFTIHQFYVLPPKVEHLFHQGMLFFYISGALVGFMFTASKRRTFSIFAFISISVLLISLVTMFTSKLLPLLTFVCMLLFGSLLRTFKIYGLRPQGLLILITLTAFILTMTKYVVRKDCYLDRPFERAQVTSDISQILRPLTDVTGCVQTLAEIEVRGRVRDDLTTSIENDLEGRLNHESKLDNQSSSRALFLERIVRRVSHLKYLGRVMHEVTSEGDSIGYSHYGKILIALVPRLLWPNKPSFINANEFGRKFQFIEQSDFVTSVNLDVITEAWIVDRWWGVVCSASVVSSLAFLIWLASTFFASRVIKIAILCLIPINTFALESGLGAFFLGTIQHSFVLGFVIVLLLRFKLLKRP